MPFFKYNSVFPYLHECPESDAQFVSITNTSVQTKDSIKPDVRHMKNTIDEALCFIHDLDAKRGQHWSDATDALADAMVEYAALKIKELEAQPKPPGLKVHIQKYMIDDEALILPAKEEATGKYEMWCRWRDVKPYITED